MWPSVLERVGGNAAGEIPRLEQGEQTTPTDRSRSSKSQSNHRHKSPKPAGGVTLPLLGGVARPVEKVCTLIFWSFCSAFSAVWPFCTHCFVYLAHKQGDKKPKRRCRKRDPNEVPSQPWSEEEIGKYKQSQHSLLPRAVSERFVWFQSSSVPWLSERGRRRGKRRRSS